MARVWNLHFPTFQVREEVKRTFGKEYLPITTKMLHVLYSWPYYFISWNLFEKNINSHHKDIWPKRFTAALYAAAAVMSLQSCPTLCNPIDGSPSGSPVPGILQARTLEWVAISFSNAWTGKGKVKSLSRVWLLATPWTAAHQAPPSMGFSRHEYWSGCSTVYNIITQKREMT